MTRPAQILLVDDELSIQRAMAPLLRSRGYGVTVAGTGREALDLFARERPDLLILDLGLPDMNGIEVCRQVRELADTPILILSARGAEKDKVAALDQGADDYMTKPFDVDELLARVRVLQRRLRGAAVNVVEHGRLRLDPGSFSVLHEGRPVPLQRREFMLLQKLLASPGQVLTRAQLEESLYGWDGNVESNALDVHVHNLRKKLYPEVIRTVRGIGYVADPPA